MLSPVVQRACPDFLSLMFRERNFRVKSLRRLKIYIRVKAYDSVIPKKQIYYKPLSLQVFPNETTFTKKRYKPPPKLSQHLVEYKLLVFNSY